MSVVDSALRLSGEFVNGAERLRALTAALIADLVRRQEASWRAGLQALHADFGTCVEYLAYLNNLCTVAGFAFQSCHSDLAALQSQTSGEVIVKNLSAFERLVIVYESLFVEARSPVGEVVSILDRTATPGAMLPSETPIIREIANLLARLTAVSTRTDAVLDELEATMRS